jgi:hypothetical protein
MDYLLISDANNNRLLKVPFTNGVVGSAIGTVTTYAGAGAATEVDSGTGLLATFAGPFAIDGWRCILAGYGAVSATQTCAQCPPGTYAPAYGGLCKTCATAYGYGATTC